MSRVPAKTASAKAVEAPATRAKPTDAELAILQVLWRKGPSTLSEVHEEIATMGYTTVQTFLKIMREKGLVQADRLKYAWRYKAAYTEDEVQRHLVSTLLTKAFGGSPAKLLMQALASNKTSSEEIAAIRRLCEQHKKT